MVTLYIRHGNKCKVPKDCGINGVWT